MQKNIGQFFLHLGALLHLLSIIAFVASTLPDLLLLMQQLLPH